MLLDLIISLMVILSAWVCRFSKLIFNIKYYQEINVNSK